MAAYRRKDGKPLAADATLVLVMGFLIVVVVGYLVAMGCYLWCPVMVQVVLNCIVCTLIFANVLFIARLLLDMISEKKGE